MAEGDFVIPELLGVSWQPVLSVAPFLCELPWREKNNHNNQNLRNQEKLVIDFSVVTLHGCQTPETLLAGTSVGVLLECLCLWLSWCLLLSWWGFFSPNCSFWGHLCLGHPYIESAIALSD